MRDILVTVIIFGALPFCFLRPWIGIVFWTWLGLMNPHRLTYGFAYNMPFAQMVALAIILGLIFTKDKRPLPATREVYLLFLLWAIFLISTFTAIYPEDAWNQLFKVSKTLFVSVLTLFVMQDRKKLLILTWVIVFSLGYYGLKGGVFAVLTGGQYRILGPADSYIEGNTNLGLALNMILPLILYLRSQVAKPWLRHFLLALFLFTVIAILITYSRGALLGLIAVIFLLVLKSKKKFVIIPLIAFCIVFAKPYMPEKWFGRMETIQGYEEESSAMARIKVWGISYRLACDKPLFGGGFETFSNEIYYQYLTQEEIDKLQGDVGTGAHSIYLQTLAEHGFIGLSCYIGLCISLLLSLRKTIKRSKRYKDLQWITNYASMLEVGFYGFFVSGIFLSMQYFDLFYTFLMITIILKNLVLTYKGEKTNETDNRSVYLSHMQGSSGMRIAVK